jgi:hypothetical protein
MIKNNAAQAGENACRNESSLDSRYGGDGGLIAPRGVASRKQDRLCPARASPRSPAH